MTHLGLCDGIGDSGLTPWERIKVVGVDNVANGAVEPRLEYDAGQSEPGEAAVVPSGHATHVHGRVGRQPAKLQLFAGRRSRACGVVHRQRGDSATAFHGHAVPSAVVQVVAGHQDLRASSQVVP